MMYINAIVNLLSINTAEAVKVLDRMMCNGVDFSECSTRTFNKEAKIAYEEIKNS